MLSYFSSAQLFVTLRTKACQTSLSIKFFRQQSWSGLPCLPSADLPDQGIKSMPLKSPALTGGFFILSSKYNVTTLCIIYFLLTSSLYMSSVYFKRHCKFSIAQGRRDDYVTGVWIRNEM